MNSRHLIYAILLSLFLLILSPNSQAADQANQPDKALVQDGHVVHNLGHLANNVTNFGLIGSEPTRPSAHSETPSAHWPDADGVNYLWGAGLWVGGMVQNQPHVSTAEFSHEIMASAAPGDTIFSTYQGAPGGRRYPWLGADDDADGQEDEDPLDGVDNDGDGLIDEDFSAAGDQEFSCVMSDTTAAASASYADHTPLNISVRQRSYQWDTPETADFIGYEYTITNVGTDNIEGLYCGLFSDFDIGVPDSAAPAEDDLAGGWNGDLVRASNGTFVPVKLAYMRDGAAGSLAPGWAGWVFCELATNPRQLGAPATNLSMQIMASNVSFSEGGDPTSDAERYQLLSAGTWDSNVPQFQPLDYRVLIGGAGPAVFTPGDSVTFRVALVMGTDLSNLLTNAAEAVLTSFGQTFDRDGDPDNGQEYRVPWLRPADGPSAVPEAPVANNLNLLAAPNPFNPRVTLSFTLPEPGQASLTIHDQRGHRVRTLLQDTPATATVRRIWDGTDSVGRSVASGVYVARLIVGRQVVERRISLVR